MSCVSGGPMDRLVDELRAVGAPADVHALYAPERWRALMSAGAFGRLRARLGAFFWFPLRALWASLWQRNSVLVPTTNPFLLPALLVFTRFVHRQPVVPLIYDLFPDVLEASRAAKADGLVSKLLKWSNRRMLERADAVVFIGEHMARHAIARYGEPKQWTVIATGARSAEFVDARIGPNEAESELEHWCSGKTIVSYVGNMGQVHDWETMAAAIERLMDLPSDLDFGVVIAASGPGQERMLARLAKASSQRVRFEAPLPDRAWARLLRISDVSLVSLKEEARHTSVPSKAFSAMAARNAIVAVAPKDSDLGQLILQDGAGVVVAPGDVPGLTDALIRLLRSRDRLHEMQSTAFHALRTKYDLPKLAERWLEFCARTTGRGS